MAQSGGCAGFGASFIRRVLRACGGGRWRARLFALGCSGWYSGRRCALFVWALQGLLPYLRMAGARFSF